MCAESFAPAALFLVKGAVGGVCRRPGGEWGERSYRKLETTQLQERHLAATSPLSSVLETAAFERYNGGETLASAPTSTRAPAKGPTREERTSHETLSPSSGFFLNSRPKLSNPVPLQRRTSFPHPSLRTFTVLCDLTEGTLLSLSSSVFLSLSVEIQY